ncbi:MAG: MFS transporter, partial [Chloroflexi bacterium]|nr:MFS transporter [Chloroflexota bacterium]
MYDLVGREAVMNAKAGQFIAFHGASIFGPFAAGFLLGAFGFGPIFLGVSGLIFVASLLLLALPSLPKIARPAGSVWQNLREGLAFALHDRPIRTVILVVLFTESLGYSSRSMFPVVARDVLHAGPAVLGLLSALWGIGGLIGAIGISSFGYVRPKGWVFLGSAFGFGAFLLLFAFSRSLPLSLVLLLLAGGFGVIYDTMASTLLQTLAPDAMRGRVMGLYSFVVSGFSLGALVMGTVAKLWGVTAAIAGGGGIVSVNALQLIPVARLIGERSAVGSGLSPASEDSPAGSPAATE